MSSAGVRRGDATFLCKTNKVKEKTEMSGLLTCQTLHCPWVWRRESNLFRSWWSGRVSWRRRQAPMGFWGMHRIWRDGRERQLVLEGAIYHLSLHSHWMGPSHSLLSVSSLPVSSSFFLLFLVLLFLFFSLSVLSSLGLFSSVPYK